MIRRELLETLLNFGQLACLGMSDQNSLHRTLHRLRKHVLGEWDLKHQLQCRSISRRLGSILKQFKDGFFCRQ